MNLRTLLWNLGVMNTCPICGGKMISRGFNDTERYECLTLGCPWNIKEQKILKKE